VLPAHVGDEVTLEDKGCLADLGEAGDKGDDVDASYSPSGRSGACARVLATSPRL